MYVAITSIYMVHVDTLVNAYASRTLAYSCSTPVSTCRVSAIAVQAELYEYTYLLLVQPYTRYAYIENM